jgi:hypothetical protein
MMRPWLERPNEFANLFNPAFCAYLLRNALAGFEEISEEGIPFAQIFFILPLILHKKTRELLPKSAGTKLHVWIQKNPSILIGLPSRIRNLVPFTREAIMFGLHMDFFAITENGNVISRKARLRKKPRWPSDSEPGRILRKSQLIGKLLANAGNTTTIYTLFGVRP